MQTKLLNPIRIDAIGEVFVTVKWDGLKLSITGVEGPKSNGDCRGSAGQIDMSLREDDRSDWRYNRDWDSDLVSQLLEVWDRWHLNDMKAGTPKQEAFIREWRKNAEGVNALNSYDRTCEALREAELLYDHDYPSAYDKEKTGYRYGTAWLTEQVPDDVIEWLFNLPDAVNQPPARWQD